MKILIFKLLTFCFLAALTTSAVRADTDTTPPTTTAILSGTEGQPTFFRSDVNLTLDAQDNLDGSGVNQSFYKFSEEDWQIYIGPITLIHSQPYTIMFYSTDNTGNTEDVKTISFTIDKNAPEMSIYFDTNTLDFVFTSIDENGSSVIEINNLPQNREQITAADTAGNTTQLTVKDRQKGKKGSVNLESVTYNNSQNIDLSKNKLVIDAEIIGAQLEDLSQKWTDNGVVKVRAKYDQQNIQSSIFTRFNGEEKLQQVLPGLIILNVQTFVGNLTYTYL